MTAKELYQLVESTLKGMTPDGVDVEKYFTAAQCFDIHSKDTKLNDIFERFICSLQNRNMMPSVINYHGRREEMSRALYGYCPIEVRNHYKDPDEVYAVFKREIADLSDTPSRLWITFCKGILSGADFFAEMGSSDEVRRIFDTFQDNPWMRTALPTLLAEEIDGIRFTLACDFLKEIGYDYPKPDVHMMDVFKVYLKDDKMNDLKVYKEIIRCAKEIGVSAYKLDKMIWMICSGKFYYDDIHVSDKKEELMDAIRKH